jgi:hypothetical protein
LVEPLSAHLERIKSLYEQDRRNNLAPVTMPHGMEKKFSKCGNRWEWFWLWPSREVSEDPRASVNRRHHVLDRTYQRLIRNAAAKAGNPETRDPAHSEAQFRDAFAGIGNGHSHRPRTHGPSKRGDDADLHARHVETGIGGEKSVGWLIGGLWRDFVPVNSRSLTSWERRNPVSANRRGNPVNQ